MTKEAAIQNFMSGFDLVAYEQYSVPTGENAPEYPYLTYALSTAYWGDGEQVLQVNLWYNTKSNVEPNAKAEQIAQAVGLGGVKLNYTGGQVWIKRGSPFCQSMADPTDEDIKRRYIVLVAEFLGG